MATRRLSAALFGLLSTLVGGGCNGGVLACSSTTFGDQVAAASHGNMGEVRQLELSLKAKVILVSGSVF